LREDIAFNETDLAFNETDLEFNETNHAFNETDIAFNETDLAFNETDIAFNEADIAFNKTDIAFNDTDFIPAGLNYTFHNMTELDEYCVMEKIEPEQNGNMSGAGSLFVQFLLEACDRIGAICEKDIGRT